MSFTWAPVLLSVLLVPLATVGYVWLIRRRRRRTVTYSSVALLRQAGATRGTWRRHLPFALVAGALACLGVAGARPQISSEVPVTGSAVIVALDVSGSMCATDVDPNRLTAAQTAVRKFVEDQADETRIGLVLFSGNAQIAVAPTLDRQPVLATIDAVTTSRGTAIGAAILKAVDAIAEIDVNVEPAGDGPSLAPDGTGGDPDPGLAPGGQQVRPPFAPEIVVLLTDGANTAGMEPVPAAHIAAARGVRVFPIGFGTTNPTSMVCTAEQLGGSNFVNRSPGGFGGGSPRRGFLVADEETLREVARVTGGTYFTARGADQLQGVLEELPRKVETTHRETEVSAALAGLAAVLVLLSIAAAARWSTFPS